MRHILAWCFLGLLGISAPSAAQPLTSQHFEIVRLGSDALRHQPAPKIYFETATRVVGSGGCNRFAGQYVAKLILRPARTSKLNHPKYKLRPLRTWTIRFENVASTLMYCGPVSAQEQRFFAALKLTRRYVLRDGNLSFYGAAGRMPLFVMSRVAG